MKTCSKCKVPKDESKFRGRRSGCRECEVAYEKTRDINVKRAIWSKSARKMRKEDPKRLNNTRREWFKKNPQKEKGYNLKKNYGLSIEKWNEMFLAQKGVCAICKNKVGGKGLFVDHNHTSGAIRGLLCPSCNAGLGMFKETPGLFKSALDYLESYAPSPSNNYASPELQPAVVV